MKVLGILKKAHDEDDHWVKQRTLIKLRDMIYWPSQFMNVEKYIQDCLNCAFHNSVMKSQLLHSIRVRRFFQLIRFDFIGLLLMTEKGYFYIFHVLEYLSRFSITFFTKTVNVDDVILALKKIFSLYVKLVEIYCDHDQHFENFQVKSFLSGLRITLTFNSFETFQSTEMMKVDNKF